MQIFGILAVHIIVLSILVHPFQEGYLSWVAYGHEFTFFVLGNLSC